MARQYHGRHHPDIRLAVEGKDRQEKNGVGMEMESVGCGVPANPYGSNTWVRAKSFPPTDLRPSSLRSRGRTRNSERYEVYTGSGHCCGVIPYSSVVVVDCLLG